MIIYLILYLEDTGQNMVDSGPKPIQIKKK
jgi:hypothetical protein